MRYLTISKGGVWYFRYQLPTEHQCLFDNRNEIKRSLRTSCKLTAKIKALSLELEIRTKIQGDLSSALVINNQPIQNIVTSDKRQLKGACPFKCLEEYFSFKADFVSSKTNEDSYNKCRVILNLLSEKEITKIRRKEAESIRQQLKYYPSNLKKHKEFKGLSGKQAMELNQRIGKPVLSSESIKYYIQKCSSFFEWAVQREYTDLNPFKGFKFISTRKSSEAKHAYTQLDLKKIFSTDIHTQEHSAQQFSYWLPILASLTGARLNELCQLYKDNIFIHEGIWCIQITDGHEGQKIKNQNSRRIIPLHSKLIELGFIKHINSIEGPRVFPDLLLKRDGYGTSASKWFARFKTKLGFQKGHDFHSFRHTVANELKQAGIPQERAAALLGHSQQGITYDRYGKDISPKLLVETIETIPASHLNSVKKHYV